MENCIICNSSNIKIENFIFKCKNCNFLKSSLKPGFGREIEGISEIRKKNFKKIVNIIKSFDKNNKLKILEIGSGNGLFIKECENQKIDITGSEADDEQYLKLKENFTNILKIDLPLDKKKRIDIDKYDYVVFNDVFEHLQDLNLILIQLKNFLNDEGKVLINIPSSNGTIYKFSEILNLIGISTFYNRMWQKDLSSPHLSYFNKYNLEMLFKKHNYELIHLDTLNSIDKNNFERLNSTIKNKFFCYVLTFLLFFYFFVQKILPKDYIFHIYKLKN